MRAQPIKSIRRRAARSVPRPAAQQYISASAPQQYAAHTESVRPKPGSVSQGLRALRRFFSAEGPSQRRAADGIPPRPDGRYLKKLAVMSGLASALRRAALPGMDVRELAASNVVPSVRLLERATRSAITANALEAKGQNSEAAAYRQMASLIVRASAKLRGLEAQD